MKSIQLLVSVCIVIGLSACANGNNSASKTSPSTPDSVQEVVQKKVAEAKDEVLSEPKVKSQVESKDMTSVPVSDHAKTEVKDDKPAKMKEEDQPTKSIKSNATPKTVITSQESTEPLPERIEKNTPSVIKNEVKVETSTEVEEVKTSVKGVVKEANETSTPQTETKVTSTENRPEKQVRVAQSRPMHKYFDYILKTHVSGAGVVDYKGIKSDVSRLDKYLADLESFSPKSDWTNDEKLAYWINAYNAYTLKLIVENYPLKSITDLHGGKPWDHKWISIDGKSLSLNAIENEIIRPTFKEPRIHFAVNCAAKSCPPLMNRAYTKDNLESLLASSTSAFINNPAYNNLTKKPAEISKIFEWYAEDFGDVVTFVNKYMNSKQPPIKEIVYSEYDWSLNDM